MTAAPSWILWSGTVGLESPVLPRVEAALASGYERLSLSPLDVARAGDSGMGAEELGAVIRDAGLHIVLDPVTNWHAGPRSDTSRFARFSAEDSLTMCGQLQAVSLTAVALAGCAGPVEELAGPFGELCDRAADLGLQVHLEFIPMTVVADLRTALAIVEGAGRDNGGIVFDTWHFFRGTPDFAVLAAAPGERIFAVQVDDAHASVSGSLREDTQRRLLPGDGDFELPRVIGVLADIGALRWIGPEVISPELAAMPPVEAARLAKQRVQALLPAAPSSNRL